MFEDDLMTASADGILNCLRLLAEEAATLKLQRTLWAIQDALETAEDERAETVTDETAPAGKLLH